MVGRSLLDKQNAQQFPSGAARLHDPFKLAPRQGQSIIVSRSSTPGTDGVFGCHGCCCLFFPPLLCKVG